MPIAAVSLTVDELDPYLVSFPGGSFPSSLSSCRAFSLLSFFALLFLLFVLFLSAVLSSLICCSYCC